MAVEIIEPSERASLENFGGIGRSNARTVIGFNRKFDKERTRNRIVVAAENKQLPGCN